jgi:LEA14-like dessication related protein
MFARFFILRSAAIVTLVAWLGLILYGAGVIRAPELEGVTISWGEVTEQSTTVAAAIDVNNRLPIGLGSDSIGIDVPIYFCDVEAVRLHLPSLALPRGQSTLNATATMIQANFPQWWAAFIQQGEVLSIDVKPDLKAKVLGKSFSHKLPSVNTTVPIPIMSSLHSTEPMTMGFDDASVLAIVQNPGSHFVVSPPTPARPIITVESWELHWGNVTTETTQVLGTVVLRNQMPVPIPIQGLRIGLDMNNISVIPNVAMTPTRSEILPGESVGLLLQTDVDNGRLVQWWTSHLQNGENTAVKLRIGVTIVLPITSSLGITDPITLPLLPVPGFGCNIHTDIMGVANYRIAQMLGKPVGEEPKAVEVQINLPEPPRIGDLGSLLGL